MTTEEIEEIRRLLDRIRERRRIEQERAEAAQAALEAVAEAAETCAAVSVQHSAKHEFCAACKLDDALAALSAARSGKP